MKRQAVVRASVGNKKKYIRSEVASLFSASIAIRAAWARGAGRKKSQKT
jgi:hypothetical protein